MAKKIFIGGITVFLVAITGVAILVLTDDNSETESVADTENGGESSESEFIEHSEEERDFIAAHRSADVPELPFDDNPDPTQCGIPVVWGSSNNVAYLSGLYEGQMIQEEVLLYDSHNRLEIVASAPHGSEVEILMFQDNPVMNYYRVRIVGGPEGANTGWIPAAFISREPVDV